jgi:predicted Zn-dependent protease
MSQSGRIEIDGLMSREAARALSDRVLKMSAAEQTRVTIVSSQNGNTRFADGSITTSGEADNMSVTVTATLGRRRASATTNILEDASLKRTVDQAVELARLAPEDPELMPELGPQTYSNISAFVERTANLDAETRSTAVRRAIEAANSAGKAAGQIFTAGFLDYNAAALAVATSAGLFAYHRTTMRNFSVTAPHS